MPSWYGLGVLVLLVARLIRDRVDRREWAKTETSIQEATMLLAERMVEGDMRRLALALDNASSALCDGTEIGPVGVLARAAVGLTLSAVALFWNDPSWADPLAGFLVMPGIVTGLLALCARRRQRPLRATGPLGHLANAAVFVALFAHPATVGSALLFYGGSMLVAATRRAGGCEVTATANAFLRHDDQVGCVLFAPVDLAEARLRRCARAPPRSAIRCSRGATAG